MYELRNMKRKTRYSQKSGLIACKVTKTNKTNKVNIKKSNPSNNKSLNASNEYEFICLGFAGYDVIKK